MSLTDIEASTSRPRTFRVAPSAAALLATSLVATSASAQSIPYVASQFTAPFTPLSTGTTVILQPNFSFPDQSVIIPIGFTFSFYGVHYDWVEVGENGVVQFKNTCAMGCGFDEFCDFSTQICTRGSMGTGDFEGLPSTNLPNRLIAPFWDDLQLDSTLPASVVQYRLIGAAPNRELVIEWRNMRHTSFRFQPTGRANFQVRLRETSNVMRMAYGSFTQGPDNVEWSGRVGIEDETGINGIIPLSCAQNQGMCDWTALATLNNQVIEIGIPNTPELTGTITPVLGAQVGDTVQLSADISNLGLQPTTVPFTIGFYLSSDSIITPGVDTLLGTAVVSSLAAGQTTTATASAVVPTVLPGYYSLGAYIDTGNVITEATKANNTLVSPEPFLIGSDLEVQLFDVPPPLPPGGSADVTFQVINRSSAAHGMAWRLWLSADGALDAGDMMIADGTADFEASSTTSVVAHATLDASVLPGFYTLIAEVDPFDTLVEIDENNNQAFGFANVGPDAYATGMTVAQSSGSGATLPFSLNIENTGSEVAAIEWQLYLSSDPQLDSNDPLFASGTTALSASHEEIVQGSGVVPSLASTTYYFIAVIDPNNLVPEVDESNNVSVLNTIQLVGPDLVAQSVDGGPIAFRGRTYTLHGTISNQGGEPVRGVYASFHFSVNQLITTSDPMLVQVGPFDLEPGNEIRFDPVVTVDPNTTRGQYWIGLIADSTSVVPNDIRSNNNIKRSATQILVRDPAPDYLITELVVPSGAGAGEPFPVQRTLENQGNAPGDVTYDIYLVSQSTATRYALVGHGSASLAPGSIQVAVDTLTAPAQVAAGTYRIEYDIDPDNVLDEISDDNNVLVSRDSVVFESAGLLITSTTLPIATTGLAYETRLTAHGGTGPLTWSLASGTLPTGLAIDSASGEISGTPTGEGSSTFTVHVTDGALSDDHTFSILVAASTVDLRIVTRALPPIWAGVAIEYPMTAVGGIPPYTWSVSPRLPLGLTLTSSGAIAGTTSTTAPSNVYTFRVTDAVGTAASSPIALRVLARSKALRFAGVALADGVVGNAYAEPLNAVNGIPPYTYSVVSGSLPDGITLEGDQLAGVPSRAGVYTFRLQVSDTAGDSDEEYFVIDIEGSSGVRFVTKGLPFGTVGKAYLGDEDRPVFLKAIATGTSAAVKYDLVGGALPAGLTLGDDGKIDGTPTMSGASSFLVRATNGFGETDIGAFGIQIDDVTVIPTTPATDDGCGCTAAGSDRTSGGGSGAGWLALVALGGLLFVRRRRTLAAMTVAALALTMGSSSALAQRGDAGIPSMDAGAGPGPGLIQYFQSTRTETYVERTGGAPLMFTSNDDSEVVVPLPFPFRFFENDYNDVHVSTNGYVAFNEAAFIYSNETIPSPNTPNNSIFGVWDDLWTTDVTTYTEGTAPNRIFIIQWRNSAHLGDNGHSFNMQFWLYEGGAARFEIHYGPNLANGGFSYTFSTGFENSTGTDGMTLLACTPNCSGSDLAALPDTVIQVLQDAGEDLAAGRVQIVSSGDPLHVYQGVPFDVTSSINSYHGQPIGPFTYSLYLLAQGQDTPSGAPFFTSAPITLSPYQSLEATDSVTIPISTPEGRYRIALVADPTDQIAEPNENNNVVIGGQEFLIGARQPDLRIPDVTVSNPSAAPGGMLSVSVTVENFGNLDTSTDWRIVLSSNSTPSASDLVLYTSPSNVALAAASSQTFDVTVTLPAVLRPGRYFIGAIADPNNAIAEINEVNNTGRTSRAVLVGTTQVAITTTDLPTAYVGSTYSAQLEASGGDGSYVFDLMSGTPPAGLTFVPGTGELRGRATAAGSASLTVRVTSNGLSATKTLTLEAVEPDGPLTIVTRAVVPGTVGLPYPPGDVSDPASLPRLVAVGGNGPITFSLTSTPPPGLTLDADGLLHGVPTGRGTFTMTVAASDGTTTVSRDIPITLVEQGRLSIVAGALPEGTLGQPYSYSFFTLGKLPTSTLQFGLVSGSGALPPGLTLSTSGELSGTPGKVGAFGFEVEVVEGAGADAARDTAHFTLVVTSQTVLSIFPSTLPEAVVGTAYEVTLEARQGSAPYMWSVSINGDLPRGLTQETVEESGEAKVRIHGTPEEVPDSGSLNANTGGLVAFSVTLVDGQGRKVQQAFALRVVEAPKMIATTDSGGCTSVTLGDRTGLPWGAALMVLAGLFVRRRKDRA